MNGQGNPIFHGAATKKDKIRFLTGKGMKKRKNMLYFQKIIGKITK